MKPLVIIEREVMKGDGKGRELGFPTINMEPGDLDLDYGVYTARVTISAGVYKGALHYGPRKTLNDSKATLEVYILDFSGDLYGQMVKVEIFSKLRNVEWFDSLDNLKKAIYADVEKVRQFTY